MLTEKIIGAAIEVHRHLGPGLLESTYERCLAQELDLRKISYVRQKLCPIHYKGILLEDSYRIDFLIENQIIIEVKAIDNFSPVHEAQLLTYLRFLELKNGLLLNFNTPTLKSGIKRISL